MKKTLRYRRDLVGLMVIGVASGSCNVILAGGVPYRLSRVVLGWKNIVLHLSVLMVKPESLSQEKMQLATLISFSAMVLYVGPKAKMRLLSM